MVNQETDRMCFRYDFFNVFFGWVMLKEIEYNAQINKLREMVKMCRGKNSVNSGRMFNKSISKNFLHSTYLLTAFSTKRIYCGLFAKGHIFFSALYVRNNTS